MTVEQATERVDKFLDEAALANRTRVRIIHGHGTGALRRGLAEFLKTHPLVASVAFESEDHGGKAITVVDLRSIRINDEIETRKMAETRRCARHSGLPVRDFKDLVFGSLRVIARDRFTRSAKELSQGETFALQPASACSPIQ